MSAPACRLRRAFLHLFCSLMAQRFPRYAFDCSIMTQTLQYIYSLRDAVATSHRLLKPGGVLLAMFPGISPIAHPSLVENWDDCWRLTRRSAQRLFGEVFPPAWLSVQAFGNALAAAAFLLGLAAEELSPEELDYHDPDYELLIAVRAVKK